MLYIINGGVKRPMERADVIAYIKRTYHVDPDYPFSRDYSETAVFRHQDTGKWFALCMGVRADKLKLESDELIDVVTMKSESMLIDGIISRDGFHRAYHMNKNQWMTVELGDKVPEDEIRDLIDLSFGLTEKKTAKQRVRRKEIT